MVAALTPRNRHEPDSATPATETLLLTRQQAAQMLNISVCLLDRQTKLGTIKSVRIGDRRLYRRQDLESAISPTP